MIGWIVALLAAALAWMHFVQPELSLGFPDTSRAALGVLAVISVLVLTLWLWPIALLGGAVYFIWKALKNGAGSPK